MNIYFIIGNLFSLFAVICLAISVTKKNKNKLIGWQILDTIFCMLSNIALFSYSAFTTNFLALLRNILAYKNKLSKFVTIVLTVLCVIFGAFANTRGIIGWFPITASASYTLFMFMTKNEQQMRFALISNLLLWFVHDIYIQALPSALADLTLSIWTGYQALKNRKTPSSV